MKATMPSTLQSRLLASFSRHSARTAARQGERQLTYEQLERQSGAVAHWLQANCSARSTIGLYTDDAMSLLVWMLGIMRAGCVFLPLDPGNPTKRIDEMIAEAQPALVVGDAARLAELAGQSWSTRTASLAEAQSAALQSTASLEQAEWRPEEALYIYFTSGSSGRPKAVVGLNRSLLHFIDWEIETFGLNASHNFSQLTNPGFDVYLRDTLVALGCGGTLVIPEHRELLLDGPALYRFVQEERISLIHCVPSLFRLLSSHPLQEGDLPDLQYVLLAGEKVVPAQLKPWYETFGERIQLVNLYGPTETTLAKCYYRIRPEDAHREVMPVGEPIRGARVIVLNERMEVCDTLVTGEVYIRTPYRTAGYLNDPLLNAERFIRNPFSDREDDLIYRTGDLGRMLPDGRLELAGRSDRQIKIRGVRIEPEEVENRLQSRQDISECAVLSELNPATGEASLHACVVPRLTPANTDGWLEELRDTCAELMPELMVPAGWLMLGALPRLANGKVDMRSLKEQYAAAHQKLVGPRDETEQRLHTIWCSLLGRSEMGVQSSFYQLGGTSLHLMKLITSISREFGVKLPLASLFKHNTIEKQAVLLRGKQSPALQNTVAETPSVKDYPMSRAQKRMYMLHQLHGASTMYNLNRLMEVEGALSTDRLNQAVAALAERHEALRTTFHMVDESPVQRIHPHTAIKVEALSPSLAAEQFVQPFVLDQLPLLRVGLQRLDGEKQLLILDIHHIIADAASVDILLHDLLVLYQGGELEPVRHVYRDYARQQASEEFAHKLNIQGAYWLKQYEQETTRLELGAWMPPQVKEGKGEHEGHGERLEYRLDALTLSRLKAHAADMETTLFMVMLAAMAVLLGRYSNQEDIVIGTPVLGRTEESENAIVGLFVNTLALRLRPRADYTFEKLMQDVKEHVIEALENQEYPFDSLVEEKNLDREGTRNPLFDVMFTFHYATAPITLANGLVFRPLPPVVKSAKFDLSLEVAEETSGDICIALEYNPERVNHELVRRMGGHYVRLLAEVDPVKPLAALTMLHEEERHELASRNETAAPYPVGQRLEALFERQARETPEHTAIIDNETEYTYGEANDCAERLSAWLQAQGATHGIVVAVLAERSARLPIALLAILKAGAVYLPIDPALPANRIGWMLHDSGAAIVLTEHKFKAMPGLSEYKGIVAALEEELLYTACPQPIVQTHSACSPAYIIYTSGSTGRPKGVVMEHEAIVNRLHWMQKQYPLTSQDVVLQKTVFSFDVSIWELLWWSLAGASVVMLPSGEEKDPSAILSAIRRRGVTVMHFVPSMLKVWLDYMESEGPEGMPGSMRYVFASGEALPAREVQRFYSLPGSHSSVRLINLYGPTEAAIDVSFYECLSEQVPQTVPIGRPIDNIRLYVVGLHNGEQPVGAPGELCIAGVGLASGYLNEAKRTAGAFVACPFEPGGLMYRTGDIVCRQSDGSLLYLGRKDEQVKIRGFRIEPGEIEARLRTHPSVRDAVVIPAPSNQQLWAYYVPEGSERLLGAELQDVLRSQLPSYMIPAAYVPLDCIPLTPSGKVNRKALPKPKPEEDMERHLSVHPPLTVWEQQVAAIWGAVLERQISDRTADFFQMGGHSFQAFTASMRLSGEAGVEIKLMDMFLHPTVKMMAAYIEQSQTAAQGRSTIQEPIELAKRKDYYPVTSSQRRLLVLQQLEGAPLAYNMPAVFRVNGKLKTARLEESLRRLINRHESLRTSFHWVEGQPVQRVADGVDVSVERIICGDQSEAEIIGQFVRPFNLSSAPLFRIATAEAEGGDSLLLLDMHHLISDGVSSALFIKELAEAYAGGEPAPQPHIQYKDYAEWQQSRLAGPDMLAHEQFWLELFKDSEPGQLPTDYPRPAVQSFAGRRLNFPLDAGLVSQLGQLARSTGSTLFTVLFSGYMILLSKYSGHEDIHAGVAVAGRNHPDIQEVIGLFMRSLPLRSRPCDHLKIADYVRNVRNMMLQAIEHQDYPLEQLINRLELPRDMSRNPLFDTLFVMQNYTEQPVSLSDLTIVPAGFEHQTSKFDLTFELANQGEHLVLTVEFNTSLYRMETIQRMADHYSLILQQMADLPEQTIGQLTMLSAHDYRQVTEQFNSTLVPYDTTASIDQLFDHICLTYPERPAVRFQDRTITYGELGRQAALLAEQLRHQGAGPEQRIALLLPRSIMMVVSLMGTLKSGAAFVPIDPSFPSERVRFMLEDCGASLLLTAAGIEVPDFAGKVIVLSHEMPGEPLSGREEAAAASLQELSVRRDSDGTDALESSEGVMGNVAGHRLAYIMYTSGSTGNPKGVMIEHRSVHNFIVGMKQAVGWDEKTIVLAATTYSFDIFVLESVLPLTQGLAVVLADEQDQLDMKRLCRLIASSGASLLQMTPSRMRSLLQEQEAKEALRHVRQILLGGEQLPAPLVDQLKETTSADLYNMYGPTETTVWSSVSRITDEEVLTIGRPIANTRFYIANRTGNQLQGIGMPGELFIAGDGVARGYWKRPELNAGSFFSQPFGFDGRGYKTGDLAAWLPDGRVAYLGRSDGQMKLNGYRIEPEEVEAALNRYPGIREAAATVHKDSGGQHQLYAYYTSADEVQEDKLRLFLLRYVPYYMLPAVFVRLEKLPSTLNGKLDRISLARLGVQPANRWHLEPASELECRLCEIWQEVLGTEQPVGVRDSFFQLGGDSIKAISLISRIATVTGLHIKLQDLYQQPTVAELARQMESLQSASPASDPLAATMKQLDSFKHRVVNNSGNQLPDDLEDVYPMSDIQLGIVYHSLLDNGEPLYHDQFVFTLKVGGCDAAAMEQALYYMAAKHPILRTELHMEGLGESPVQLVRRWPVLDYTHQTLTDLNAREQYDYINEAMQHDRTMPFVAHQQPLWRVRTYTLNNDYMSLALMFNHAILDGWSVASMLTELLDVYKTCQTTGAAPEPIPLKSGYKHYVAEQLWLKEQEHIRMYWQEELAGYKRLELDALMRISGSTDELQAFHTSTSSIDDELLAKLRECAVLTGTNLKAVCFAAYVYTLSLFSYDNDVTVGLVENGRPAREDGDVMLGCFLNTVPIRLSTDRDESWGQWVNRVHDKLTELTVYGRLSLREIMRCAGVQPTGEQPFSDALFNFTDFHIYEQAVRGEELETEDGILPAEGYERNHARLEFTVSATMNKMNLRIASELGENATLRLRGYYLRALGQIADGLHTKLEKHSLLPEQERSCLLHEYNRTSVAHHSGISIIEQIIERARRTPQRTAITSRSGELTYMGLERRSGYLANLLRQSGVTPEQKVCVMMSRSIHWLVALVGVLRSGGCYVPVDPGFPDERVRHMLEDSRASILLTDRVTGAPADYNGTVLYMDALDWTTAEAMDVTPHPLETADHMGIAEEQLAYMIYTSGSTGRPKGVMIEHRSLNNFAAAMQHILPLHEEQKVLAVTTCSFDICILETLIPLCNGMEVVLASEEEQADPQLLARLIDEQQIHIVQLTPSRMQLMLHEPSGAAAISRASVLLLGGESLPRQLLQQVKETAPSARIFNLYGPTETTIWSASHELTEEDAVCIGTPVANTRVYITDASMQLLPHGAAGELCIAGDGLARGYWNRPEQTAGRFVINPFEKTGRLYRTGDLVRWQAAGRLEYIGRTDFQFKIRGHRIEPGEIEAELVKYAGIKEAVVVIVGEGTGARLQAYLNAQASIDLMELKQQLRAVLPEYMVPGYFVELDQFPLTANGKTDRKALTALELDGHTAERYQAPGSQMELWLAELWANVLDRDQAAIGVQSSFFDAGGDSVTIIQLHSRIVAKYPGSLTVTDLFAYPTIASLATRLQAISTGQAERYSLERAALPEGYFSRDAAAGNGRSSDLVFSRELASTLMSAAQAAHTDPMGLLGAMLLYTLHLTGGQQKLTIYRQLSGPALLALTASFAGNDELGRIIGQIQEAEAGGTSVLPQHMVSRIRTSSDRSMSVLLTDSTGESEELTDLFDIVIAVHLTTEGGQLRARAGHPYLQRTALEQLVTNYGQLIRHFMET